MKYKISVIIPVYQVEKYLNQCVASVLRQSYKNMEVILVDDGSTDNCPTICDAYAEKDKRVIVVHKSNGGLSDARNAGIGIATGEYVMFLDADDFWDDTQAIERLVKRIEMTKPDVLSYSYKKYYEESNQKKPQFFNIEAMPTTLQDKNSQLDYMLRNSLYIACACNKLISLHILKSEMMFEKGKLSEDVEWCARLLIYAKSFDFVCENFYCYRQRSGSITHTFDEKACSDLKNNIIGCLNIAENANAVMRSFLYKYTAYQLSTFVLVQAIAISCPPNCIDELSEYAWVLKHYGKNRKVRCLYYLYNIIGFRFLCGLVKAVKKMWK